LVKYKKSDMTQKWRILVPVSFGPQSDAALKYARKVSQQRNGMITCLYVIEKPGFITGKFISREIEQRIRREAELQLSAKVNRIYKNEENLSFELIVTSGKVHRKILEKASELQVNEIIMGRSDSSDLTKYILGSNASHVIAKSAIPVLTLRGSKFIANDHILLPLDLSNPVSIKIAKAIEIAALQRSRVTVCVILSPDWTVLEPAYRERLKEIKKLFANYDIECRVQLMISRKPVSDEILSVAGKIGAGQIIIMTQVESGTTDLFMGSTAREVIKRSEIPVISLTPNVQTGLYPYKSLFGNINNPITWYDMNDHLINR
jgi:nucleotide-binding universal stress UspA family protein